MTLTHEPWLVALSLIMAFQGSFVGLSLAVQVRGASNLRRRQLLAGAAVTLAMVIWSMHFVGMLAARLPITVDFLVLPTLLSFLICVLVVGIAVFAASCQPLTAPRLAVSALVMGAGICTMHYLGMYALHSSVHMEHAPSLVLASFLIAVGASGLALWLLFGLGRRPPLLISAIVMSLAISAMHYTAMAGTAFYPLQGAVDHGAPALDPGSLAILVSCVAFLVSGLFLLTLVPIQPRQRHEPSADPLPEPKPRPTLWRNQLQIRPPRHPSMGTDPARNPLKGCNRLPLRCAPPPVPAARHCRWNGTARKHRSVLARSSPSMPTRITPGSSMDIASFFVRSPSAMWNSSSTPRPLSAFTAVISSTWRRCGTSNAQATAGRCSWKKMAATRCR